jgi:hypothetical protein
LPGYEEKSRQNLDKQRIAFIQQSQTTRADVVLALGEPDGIAADESWVAYGAAYTKGGLGMAGVGLNAGGPIDVERVWRDYRRLIVYFDATGVVTNFDFTEQVCAGAESMAENITMRPCLNPRASALTAREIATWRPPDGEGRVVEFAPALWSSARSPRPWHGRVIVTEVSLTFQPGEEAANDGAQIVQIPFKDLDEVKIRQSSSIFIRHRGAVESVSVVKGSSYWERIDKSRTKALDELLIAKLAGRTQ